MIEPLELRIAPATIFAVDTDKNLLRFNSDNPSVVTTIGPITGLVGGSGELIEGIDFRPSTGQLYALGVSNSGVNSRIYTIDLQTAAATQVGADGQFQLSGVSFGFDFNPVVDRIRVVSDNNLNLRLNPNDGTQVDGDPGTAGVQRDTDLAFAAGDPNFGSSPNVVGSAYTDNFAGTTTTSLFGIDSVLNVLVRQGGINVPPGTPSPNGGALFTVGALDVNPSGVVGFDIAAFTGEALAVMTVGGATGVYSINLSTGAATLIGNVGDGTLSLRSMSVIIPSVQILNDKTATYVDEDGDRVTIKLSKGTLDPLDFRLAPVGVGGQLHLIDLSGETASDKANLTVTVAKAKGGNGLANIGYINATGVDLGIVSIRGDLGQIDAGDPDTGTPGLAKLSVHSMGSYGLATQTGGNLESNINGSLGNLAVRGDVVEAAILVTGLAIPANGKIGIATIGGSLIGGSDPDSGQISATGIIGSVKIKGDVIGGSGSESGRLVAGDTLRTVTIGGSLFGGGGNASGTVIGFAGIGSLKIGNSIFGGDGDNSALVGSLGAIVSLKIGRDLVGGSVTGFDSLDASGLISATRIGTISIGGSLIAGTDSSIGTLTNSGVIRSGNDIGSLTVRGSIIGNSLNPVLIFAKGDTTADARDLALGRITVLGRVEHARILAGWELAGMTAIDGNASIGVVSVSGDWIASDLVAGIQDDATSALNDTFGDADDIVIPGFSADSLIAGIASITIKGRVIGTSTDGDHFGFVAQQFGKFRAGGVTVPRTSGTDLPVALSPITGDVTLREI